METSEARQLRDPGQATLCGRCGATVKAGRKFCSKCGASVAGMAVGDAPVAPPVHGARCPSCGTENGPRRAFCAACGARLNGNGSEGATALSRTAAATEAAGVLPKATKVSADGTAPVQPARAPNRFGGRALLAVIVVVAGAAAAVVYRRRAAAPPAPAVVATRPGAGATGAGAVSSPAVQTAAPVTMPANVAVPSSASPALPSQPDNRAGARRAASDEAAVRPAARSTTSAPKDGAGPVNSSSAPGEPVPPETASRTPAPVKAVPAAGDAATRLSVPVTSGAPPQAASNTLVAANAKSPAALPLTPSASAPPPAAASSPPVAQPAAAPSPSAPKPAATAPLHVGGQIQSAKLIFHPQLTYPVIAREAGVEGLVRLTAVINKDGTVKALKVISGQRLLAGAAKDNVARWRYRPTLLDGSPIEVETEIDIDFKLPR